MYIIHCIFWDGIGVAKPSKRIKSNGATQKILPMHCFKKLTILQSTVEASHKFPFKIPYSIEVTYNLLAHYIWPPRLLNGGHNWTEYDPITQHPSYWSHMQTCCDYIATSTWQFFDFFYCLLYNLNYNQNTKMRNWNFWWKMYGRKFRF